MPAASRRARERLEGGEPANGWTREAERLAYRTQRVAAGYAWIYARMAKVSKRTGDALHIIAGVLGALIGTTGFSSYYGGDAPAWVAIFSALAGFAVSVIATLESTWSPAENQKAYVQTEVSYQTIATDMSWQLAQPRRLRPAGGAYVPAKMAEVDQLKLSAPLVDAWTMRVFNATFPSHPIGQPDEPWVEPRRPPGADDTDSDGSWAESDDADPAEAFNALAEAYSPAVLAGRQDISDSDDEDAPARIN